jgi:TrmH family RNA methyltransferase
MVLKSKVKYIQSLSQKKQRDEDGVFIAEGPKIINELLNEKVVELSELFAVKEWMAGNTNAPSSKVIEVDEIMLSRLSFLTTPNQVIGVFKIPDHGKFTPAGQVSLMLQNIQDPGNMGSIIRCADWFGIKQVVCSLDCVDAFNPKTVQATMGSIARVKVFNEDLSVILNAHKNIPVYAATLSGKNIDECKKISEGIIIIGNESKGISDEIMKLSTEKITIPRKGNAESLNAAVATGIILSHLVR